MSTPVLPMPKPVPLKELKENGIYTFAKYINPSSQNMSIILRMCTDPVHYTVDNIELLDVRNEVSTNVHPSDMISWVTRGLLVKLAPGDLECQLRIPM